MSLLIKGGEIITASERYKADILCEKETITRIDREIALSNDAEVIDATGKYVFPGFIDPHVHIYLPFMGTFAKDTHRDGEPRGDCRRDDNPHRDDLPRLRGEPLRPLSFG